MEVYELLASFKNAKKVMEDLTDTLPEIVKQENQNLHLFLIIRCLMMKKCQE